MEKKPIKISLTTFFLIAAIDDVGEDGQVTTKVKFEDYKKAMLNYVSEEEFERNWHETIEFSENDEGYLTKLEGGGSCPNYTIKSITKEGDNSYSAKTTALVDENDSEEIKENFEFTVKNYNGKCVIDTIITK